MLRGLSMQLADREPFGCARARWYPGTNRFPWPHGGPGLAFAHLGRKTTLEERPTPQVLMSRCPGRGLKARGFGVVSGKRSRASMAVESRTIGPIRRSFWVLAMSALPDAGEER
jgi:hypothetical protein